ncbi:zeta toxin family protein [Streptomyces sp. NPDC056982]|uniref:zeta toxin family protein n=1 Tax=Streptomyces sp. NPDC056982 TaxID=3345986 RepID=UPI00363D104F
MSNDSEVTRFQLDPKENRRIFERRIVPQLLAPARPQAAPVAVFLLGQPGAGKTRVSALLAQRLDERGGFADIDSDLYKPYHPKYAQFMREDDRKMTLYTGEDGRAWMRQAQQYARDHRLNVLVQEIAMDPEYLAQGINQYREAGHRIEVVAMGVHQALSDQGILNRYQEQVNDRGQGRLTVPEKAAASYTGIVASAEKIEREKLADYEAIYGRDEHEPRYSNELGPSGEWQREPRFPQAIEETRNLPLTARETLDFLQVQSKLRVQMDPGFRPQLSTIDAQAAPLLDPDTVEIFTLRQHSALAFPTSAEEATRQHRETGGVAPLAQPDRGPQHGQGLEG